jgi:glucosamine--fructose-6-phosphate aminotransferase (isomerizing)
MCGIIGIVGVEAVSSRLLDGLRRLEYRGYDSAGIATVVDGAIERRRAEGKLVNLAALLEEQPLPGHIGIGHTRWATHGEPSVRNAHPHANAHVALVHNGIIENFRDLRRDLVANGHVFETDTDSEAIVHLLSDYLTQGLSPQDAMVAAMARLEGAFALAVVFTGYDDLLIGARRGSPLAVGYGKGEMFLGSDALALAPLTDRIAYLDEGDIAVLSAKTALYLDETGAPVERKVQKTELSGALVGKGNYRHFMEKEIFEQPTVVGDTFNALINQAERRVYLPEWKLDLASVDGMTIIGCGTSYYAAMVGKYWIEQLAGLPVEVDIASEYRYRGAPVSPTGLSLFISQSGETIDTLSAMRYVKEQGGRTATIVNVTSSAMARQADFMLPTLAGPEIGVASTKAFMTQLAVLACLSVAMARAKGRIDAAREAELTQALIEVPARLAEVLHRMDGNLNAVVERLSEARDVLYIARGTCYPIALEGALKLKEISYIHAEGYAAGELKHGPIALISDGVPVIALAPKGHWFEKTASNIEEVVARKGNAIVITDKAGAERFTGVAETVLVMPDIDPFVAPLLYTLPIQLLAYHVAVRKGTDVDQPRNLAKSVTVE